MRVALLFFLAGLTMLQASPTMTWNFDSLTPQTGATELYPNPVMGPAFYTTVGNVNIDGPGGPCRGPESGNCVDLNGSAGVPATLVMRLILDTSFHYYLGFDLIGSGQGNTTSVTVSLGSFNQSFSLGSDNLTSGVVPDALVTVGQIFNDLTFTSTTPGLHGPLLDNVTLTPVEGTLSNAPEPAGFLLSGAGFLAMALCFARRQKQGAITRLPSYDR